MKFSCNKIDIDNSLDIVLKAVPNKTTMPVLECVVLETVENGIKLITNDMSLGIEARFNADVEEEGIILVNAKMLFDIIRKLPNETLSFEADDNNNILIFCGKSKFNIMGMDHEEFPLLPEIERDKKIVMSQYTLKEMIRQTIFSISNNESNKIYTGELFEVREDNIKITSLDLHRASIRNSTLKDSYEDIKCVIPGKTLMEVMKILSSEVDDEVEIFFTNNHVLFQIPDIIIISRLIEGNFYNVNQMINNDYEIKVKINKRELLESVDRATLLLRESESKPVIVNINGDEIKLEMNTKIGSMDENIMVEKEGKDLRIRFDPKFIIAALKVIEDEYVYLYFCNAKSPCFIKDEDSYIYMILPVKIDV